jgi:hypothetical protein
MAHLLQHQQGVTVLVRELFTQMRKWLSCGTYDPYCYPPGAAPVSLGVEAQAAFYRDMYCSLDGNQC